MWSTPSSSSRGAWRGFWRWWNTSAADLGENVDVQIVWAFEDHAQWNVIRRNMVLDPRWYDYARQVAALRTGGTRRFYYPVGFSARGERRRAPAL
jgi:hypothetical protein